MTISPENAEQTLREWTELLRAVDEVALDCDMSVEEMTLNLNRRQEAIDQIQQLDASLAELALLTDDDWQHQMSFSIRELLEEGRTLSARIRARDAQLIENATEKKSAISAELQRFSKSKGYFVAASAPKVRPPVIVDNNA